MFLQDLGGSSKVPRDVDKLEGGSGAVVAAYYAPLLTIQAPKHTKQVIGSSRVCKASTLEIWGPSDNVNIRSVVDGYSRLRSEIFMNQIITFVRSAKGSPFSICTEGNLPELISKAKGKGP